MPHRLAGLRPVSLRRGLAGAAAASLLAVVVPAGPAAALDPRHSLSLTGPTAATVGSPITLTASGVVPDDVFLNRYLNVYALPAGVVAACPTTYQNALQVKDATYAQGGQTVANTVPASGTFTLPIAYTSAVAGTFLLCGYVHEGVETMAYAQHQVTVGGGSSTQAKPTNTTRPSLRKRDGYLRCGKGAWTGSPTSYRYQWRVNGVRKAGATSKKLLVTKSLRGKTVRCGVKAINAAGGTLALSRKLVV